MMRTGADGVPLELKWSPRYNPMTTYDIQTFLHAYRTPHHSTADGILKGRCEIASRWCCTHFYIRAGADVETHPPKAQSVWLRHLHRGGISLWVARRETRSSSGTAERSRPRETGRADRLGCGKGVMEVPASLL